MKDLIGADDESEEDASDNEFGQDIPHDLTLDISPSIKSRASTPKSTTPRSSTSTLSRESQSARTKRSKTGATANSKSKKGQRKRTATPEPAAAKRSEPKPKKRKTMELRQTDMTSSKRYIVCFDFCAFDLYVAFECIMKVLRAFSLHT